MEIWRQMPRRKKTWGRLRNDNPVATETETGVDPSPSHRMPRLLRIPRSSEGTKRNALLQISEGAWPCSCLHFRLLVSRTEAVNFCCHKPPRLWYFVMAALGNSWRDVAGKKKNTLVALSCWWRRGSGSNRKV